MVRLHPKFVYCNLHSNLYLHLKKLFPYSTWAVWLHLGHSRTSWPLTWAYKKIPLVTDYWNLLSLSSIVEGFFLFFSCYASLFAFLELAFSILVSLLLQYFFVIWEIENIVVMTVTCCSRCRWGMLVDHSSSLKAEVGRWKGQGGWRPHPCQRVLWEIPGKTLFTQNTLLLHNGWFRHVNVPKLDLFILFLSSVLSTCPTPVEIWWWTPPSCRHCGTWTRSCRDVN